MKNFYNALALTAVFALSACSQYSEPSQGDIASKNASTQDKQGMDKNAKVVKPAAEKPAVTHPPLEIIPEPSGYKQNGGR